MFIYSENSIQLKLRSVSAAVLVYLRLYMHCLTVQSCHNRHVCYFSSLIFGFLK